MSRERSVLIRVPFYNYEPHHVIIGIRPAPAYDTRHPEHVIAQAHQAQPGWATLSLCEQQPVSFLRANTLRPLFSAPGIVKPASAYDDTFVRSLGGI
jgi:hypothetical protein